MACRGVFFALTPKQQSKLLAAAGDDEAVGELIGEEIEEQWDEDWLCETDKAWDAIHRCLSDGSLEADGSPRASLFVGGRQLHEDEDYVVNYLDAEQVRMASQQLVSIDEGWFKVRYSMLDDHGYDGPIDDEDFEYTWDYFVSVRALVRKAAEAGRALIFTVDQ